MKTRVLFALIGMMLFYNIQWAYTQKSNSTFEKALYSLLDFNTQQKDSLLKIVNPSESAYLSHYNLFLNQIARDQVIDNYNNQFKNISHTIEQHKKNEPRTFIFLSEIHLQKGILEYQNGNYFNSLTSFVKAHRNWQKSEEEYPELRGNLKLKGIFNLLMSNMPHPYKDWAGWVGFKGDSDLGLNCLIDYYQLTNKNVGSGQEALVYLAFSYLKFNHQEGQIVELIKESLAYEMIPIAQSVIIRCALKTRKTELIQDWMGFDDGHFLPLLYLKGRLSVLNHDSISEKYLRHFISKKKKGQFVADAYRYLSWHKFLEGDSLAYRSLQDTIALLSVYPTWEDKQAKYESELRGWPNVGLLGARILFDAGKYQTALDTLLSSRFQLSKTKSKFTEFQYRLGRCYHLMQDTTKAIFHYSEAISNGNNNNRYFAPYAALYNAEFNLLKNPDKAAFYLQEAKRLNTGENKNTIQQKIEFYRDQLKN